MYDLEVWSVSKLADFIKKTLSKKVRIQGEISQPKISSGHLYCKFKDQYSTISGIVWKFNSSINKDDICEGKKLTIEGKLDFYGVSGTTNLIIDKIITQEGQGELYKNYEKIKQDFLDKGYFDLVHKKELPIVIKNILILTSESGAALQDFLYNLDHQGSKVQYDLVDVKVQGSECPSQICDTLKNVTKIYDLVVITRGGGSFEDLFGFSQPDLIESVYNFHLPVLSAIGHQVDNPLLDLVADFKAPTPSLAAQFIVDHNRSYLQELQTIKESCKEQLLDVLQEFENKISNLLEKLYKPIYEILQLRNNLQNTLLQSIQQDLYRLSKLEVSLQAQEVINIKILFQEKQILSPQELDTFKHETLKLVWGSKIFKIKLV